VSVRNRVRSPTLFTFRDVDNKAFAELMDDGWSSRTMVGEDIVRCTIAKPSMVFRYHIARQTLYVNFYFTREQAVGREWVQLEYERMTQPVSITFLVLEFDLPIVLRFVVGTNWPINHLRHEVQITMGDSAPIEFVFLITELGKVGHRVNRRKEPQVTVSEILSLVSLTIIVLEV
jgi:hypothetical protein